MKKRTKRTVILGLALAMTLTMTLWGGYGNNSAKAAYQSPVTGYANIIDGSFDDERQVVNGTADRYHYTNIVFMDGEAFNHGAFLLNDDGDYYFPQSTLSNSFFSNNAADIGGAVYASSAGLVTIDNVMFDSNNAFSMGGAIAFTESSSPSSIYWIKNSKFLNNYAGINGGAVYLAGNPGMSFIYNSDFENNTAENHGGGIYLNLANTTDSLTIVSDDGEEHYFAGNTQGNSNYENDSNAIYVDNGTVNLQATTNSKLRFDDVIEGFLTTKTDESGYQTGEKDYHGNLKISASEGSEIILNNQIKGLIVTHDSGTLLLNQSDKLADGKAIFENVDLILSPKSGSDLRFDLINDKLDTLNINNLTITAPAEGQKMVIAFDVDLNEGKSDLLNVVQRIRLVDSNGNDIEDGHIAFDSDHFELNIIADGDAEGFQFFEGGYSNLLVGENVQFNDISKYIFTVGEYGYINVLRNDTSGLPDAVAAEGTREYSPSTLNGTVVGMDLGEMAGDSLKINMKGSDLDGNSRMGITVKENQKLEFKNGGNTSATGGAAIHSFKTEGNGALANNIGGEVIVTDSTIEHNTSKGLGGAIYSEGGKVTLNANERDVIFRYNTAKGLTAETPETPVETPETPDTPVETLEIPDTPVISDAGANNTVEDLNNNNDIYLKDASMTVNGGKNTVIESGIAGTGTIQKNDTGILKLAGDNSLYTGDLNLNGGEVQLLKGAKFFNAQNTNVLTTTNINLINNDPTDKVNFGALNLEKNANLGVDADIATGSSDKIDATSVTGDGKVVINNINLSSLDPSSKGGEFSVITLDESGDSPLLGYVEVAGGNNQESMGAIYKYVSDFDPNTGMMKISSIGGGNTSGYNPAVMASPVATLVGGYLTQLNSYDMAFNNMDLYMLLTEEERMALKYANRYAAASLGGVYSPLMLPGGQGGFGYTSNPYQDGNTWFKPYSMFEDVKLKNGPKVSNVAYGTFFGYDSNLKEFSNGWDGMWSVYGGYNGSHQTYQGNGIYQNGGTLGASGMLYKGNFYTGLTANAGANAAKADTIYTDDEDFAMFMTGVAWKLGYNSEFFDSKLIIQPNYMMSYSFIETFDYTNGAGVKIDAKGLNALQFMPGLRIIGNLSNGWKPYLAASMVWTAMDGTDFNANDVSLPELSLKPYFNYGVGIQKSGERFGGFFQTMMRAGGREGVFLQAGLNMAF